MRAEQFMDKYLHKGGKITPLMYGVPWDFWRRLLDFSRFINFGCGFNGQGCTGYRAGLFDHLVLPEHRIKVCCAACEMVLGYQEYVESESRLQAMAGLFAEESGFWTAGSGCRLPPSDRSRTCIVHTCHHLQGFPQAMRPGTARYIEAVNNPLPLYDSYRHAAARQPEEGCELATFFSGCFDVPISQITQPVTGRGY